MTAAELNEIYGAVISPDARVFVPASWMPAVHDALRAIEELPTDIRAFAIVTGVIESDGQLQVKIAAAPEYMPENGMQRIAEIIEKAQAAVRASMH
ncbi:hypothetical protein [Sinorhizobium fredii]|uniref:hypothetical protein n=1 Tax=Rhizobium fredii TaxID=380 RepID=UPI0004B94C82|nr:hypothetical protein [Sinorhizobium fredii]UTY48561.1 hypothetical protein EPK84_18185 [Sinorhizobium fredii]